jgi:transcriptional regulator with XRE-family HTH domain
VIGGSGGRTLIVFSRKEKLSNDLGRTLKQRRVMIPLTLKELSEKSGVSASHLGRIERGERFPSARILRKIAKPLGFEEGELFTLADYLSPQPHTGAGKPSVGQLDPYVAAVLSQEVVEVQRAVVTILTVFKSLAKTNDSNIGFAEYVRRKYPEVEEDTITMIKDILEHPKVATKLK